MEGYFSNDFDSRIQFLKLVLEHPFSVKFELNDCKGLFLHATVFMLLLVSFLRLDQRKDGQVVR